MTNMNVMLKVKSEKKLVSKSSKLCSLHKSLLQVI